MQIENDLKWSAEQKGDRIRFRLSGELSRNTLLPLWHAWREGKQQASFLMTDRIFDCHIVWDLAQIHLIDSAGFALLCNLVEDCNKTQSNDKTLSLENPPPQLLTLADLFGLSDWIKPFIK